MSTYAEREEQWGRLVNRMLSVLDPEFTVVSDDPDSILAELEATGLLDPGHTIDVGVDRWAIQHPPACRPDLLSCAMNDAMEIFDGPPKPLGRYRAELIDGEVVFGEKVAS